VLFFTIGREETALKRSGGRGDDWKKKGGEAL